MPTPFVLKLEFGADLEDEDRALLEQVAARTRRIEARQDVIREGERPDSIHLVQAGFACREKLLPDGKRQIMALLVPGDFCDLHIAILDEMDHTISTLSACTMAEIPRETIEELTSEHPRITRALWWATLVDEAVLREWLVNMGQREADRQMAHLLCELLVRLQSVGLASENAYDLPMTQVELGDTLGISVVHVNRTLKELRDSDLVRMERKRVTITDVERLKAFAGFTPNYLHLVKRNKGSDPHR